MLDVRRALRIAVVLAGVLAGCERAASWTDRFETDPFSGAEARWCERYHHAHLADGGGISFVRSERSSDACTADGGRSCVVPGCDPCGCEPPCSPCAKVGDAKGNAIVMTTHDALGDRRVASARFTIVRQMPPEAHVGIYVALHPHCHTTVQGLLVADRPGEFHLNVAAFNEFIGGDPAQYESCRSDPFAEISPPLAAGLRLDEGRTYEWELSAALVDARRIDVASVLRDENGGTIATATHTFDVAGASRWFGVAGGAARYGFGAEYTRAASPSGGEPELLLTSFTARP